MIADVNLKLIPQILNLILLSLCELLLIIVIYGANANFVCKIILMCKYDFNKPFIGDFEKSH